MSSRPDPYWVKSCPPKNTALGGKSNLAWGEKFWLFFTPPPIFPGELIGGRKDSSIQAGMGVGI